MNMDAAGFVSDCPGAPQVPEGFSDGKPGL
jgi:hypothetical protein